MNKDIARKNKLLAAALAAVAIIATLGAIAWLSIYAPMVVR